MILLPADPVHSLLTECKWIPDWGFRLQLHSSRSAPLTPLFMFTLLLPRRQHIHALRTANPWRADRRAGERGRDTEGERERVRKREGRETSARAAFQSESFVSLISVHENIYFHSNKSALWIKFLIITLQNWDCLRLCLLK